MYRDFGVEAMSFPHALVILDLSLVTISVLFEIKFKGIYVFENTDQTGGVEVDLERHKYAAP